MKSLLLILIPFIALIGCKSSHVIHRGDSLEQVISAWGEPSATSDLTQTWERKFGDNNYSVKLLFDDDITESRLHPTRRVSYVTLVPDHQRNWKNFANEVPFVRDICASGCSALGEIDNFDRPFLSVMLCPGNNIRWESQNTWLECVSISLHVSSLDTSQPVQWDSYNVDDAHIGSHRPVDVVTHYTDATTFQNLGQWKTSQK